MCSQDSSPAPLIPTANTPTPRRPIAPSSSTASAIIYREQNKTTEAVAAYKQIIDLGGDYAKSGYQGEIDAYRDAHSGRKQPQSQPMLPRPCPRTAASSSCTPASSPTPARSSRAVALAKAQLSSRAGAPKDREVYLALAQIYIRAKRVQRRLRQLDKADALATKPDEKLYVNFLRGTLYDRQKMYDQAEAEFRKALDHRPQTTPRSSTTSATCSPTAASSSPRPSP